MHVFTHNYSQGQAHVQVDTSTELSDEDLGGTVVQGEHRVTRHRRQMSR